MKNKKILIFFAVFVFLAALVATGLIWLYKQPAHYGTASLSWNANTETNLAGYKVYYGAKPRDNNCPSGGYDNIIDVGNNTAQQLNNLTNNQTYYFSITSYNTSGKESCFSEEGKKFVPPLALIDRIKKLLNI